MSDIQQRELLTICLWLISPDIAGRNADITNAISIIERNGESLKVAVEGRFYNVKLLRDDDGNAVKLNVNRKLWSNSLFLDIAGAPKISF